jgi:hypothetical protein
MKSAQDTSTITFDFQGVKKAKVSMGDYVIATIADDGTIWVIIHSAIPIFNFGATKIWQALESGNVTVSSGKQVGEKMRFNFEGAKMERVYDYYYVN